MSSTPTNVVKSMEQDGTASTPDHHTNGATIQISHNPDRTYTPRTHHTGGTTIQAPLGPNGLPNQPEMLNSGETVEDIPPKDGASSQEKQPTSTDEVPVPKKPSTDGDTIQVLCAKGTNATGVVTDVTTSVTTTVTSSVITTVTPLQHTDGMTVTVSDTQLDRSSVHSLAKDTDLARSPSPAMGSKATEMQTTSDRYETNEIVGNELKAEKKETVDTNEIDVVTDKIREIRMGMDKPKDEFRCDEKAKEATEATSTCHSGATLGEAVFETIHVYKDEERGTDVRRVAEKDDMCKDKDTPAAMETSVAKEKQDSFETPVKDGHVGNEEKPYFTPTGLTPRQAKLAWDAKENQSPLLMQYYQNKARLPRNQRPSLPLTSISDSEVSYSHNETLEISTCSNCRCQMNHSNYSEMDDTNNESECCCAECGASSFTSVSSDQSNPSIQEISQSQTEEMSSSEDEEDGAEDEVAEDENKNMEVKLPPFYTFHHLKYEDRYKIYKNILVDCAPEDVHQAFQEHMMEAMWPCPWKAVWSSCIASEEDEEGSEEMFEVLVSVRKIYLDKEYAKVHLVRPFTCTNPKMTQCEFYTWLRMDMMNVVPLYEIYPIKDEGLNYLEPIAKAIDSARFFYQYLWRFWDSEESDDYEWISRHLERRLRLYYDIQEGKVPDASNFKKRFETMVIEANEKHSELVDLYSAVSMSDSDTDLNATDQELTQCADDLKVLRDKLEMMEDPVLRLQVLGTVEDTDK
ncbi:uncharacterized protein LOC106163647 [Lingula anatina]|uniref:Uncharacterized protein LOC106163647 n=1 Tax=Lingula anatina TaxID=7574 RepID=A0A1S3IF38_LINAN|nr:uncharacterized protein LOC106163647 [Lingula anatina]|eukprot:XP_013396758.1 uncharacterized protein LOC106163647 [Lingula anatina]